MPTTVTKSIGSSVSPLRDYATHALWISACPANLVTADQIWAGQSYNDSTFTVVTAVNITGITTDATRYVDLDVGAGQGFPSAASPIGAALQSKGVLITCSTYGVFTLQASIGNFKLHNHQITNTNNKAAYDYGSSGTSDALTENNIFESADRGPRTRYGIIRNCLSVVRTSSGNNGWYFDYYVGGTVANLTIVRPSGFTVGGTGIDSGNITLSNCAVFGFSAFKSGGTFSGSNNATDLASVGFGTSNVTSVAFSTATFGVVVDSNHDYRLVSGSALLNVGVTDTTTIPAAVDAWGTPRPQSTAWDIGFHELVAASGVTADAAWTDVQDAWAGSVSVRVDASAAWTDVQDAWVGSVTVGNTTANAAWTDIQDAWAGAAQTGVFAVAAWTDVQDAWTATATMGVFAAGAWTEIQDAWNGSITVSLPSVTCDAAWTEAQDGWRGDVSNGNADTHDPGITDAQRKRLRKQEDRRQKEFEAERAKREERKAQVIGAFERIIDGKPRLPDAVAEEIVTAIEAKEEPGAVQFGIADLVHDASRVQQLWDEFIERDDEEVLALL